MAVKVTHQRHHSVLFSASNVVSVAKLITLQAYTRFPRHGTNLNYDEGKGKGKVAVMGVAWYIRT